MCKSTCFNTLWSVMKEVSLCREKCNIPTSVVSLHICSNICTHTPSQHDYVIDRLAERSKIGSINVPYHTLWMLIVFSSVALNDDAFSGWESKVTSIFLNGLMSSLSSLVFKLSFTAVKRIKFASNLWMYSTIKKGNKNNSNSILILNL